MRLEKALSLGRIHQVAQGLHKVHFDCFSPHLAGETKGTVKGGDGRKEDISCSPGQQIGEDILNSTSSRDSCLSGLHDTQLCAVPAEARPLLEPPVSPPGRALQGALRTEGGLGAAIRTDGLLPHRGLAPHGRRCPLSSRRCRKASWTLVIDSMTPE